jgi:hypothetical protein
MALRDTLVRTGAKSSFPEYFLPADQTVLLANDQYEAQDYYAAKDTAVKALAMYDFLTRAWEAWLVRQEIWERGFVSHDSDNFSSTDEIMGDAMGVYEAGDNVAALKKVEEAILRYQLVLSNGWAGYAKQRFSMAEAERQAALDNRALIAVRNLFHEANANFEAARTLLDSSNYEEAAEQFIVAETMFITANNTTAEKRGSAAQAIEEANRRIAESKETARQADIILKGEIK